MLQASTNDSKFHYLAALLLFVAGLLILLVFISLRSKTDTSSTSATISNQAPVNSALTLNYGNSIGIVEESTTSTVVTWTVTDYNGCKDVDPNSGAGSVSAKLYRSGVSNASTCSANNLNCYNVNNAGCVVTGCNSNDDITADVSCTFDVQFYADATDADDGANDYSSQTWTVSVTSTDVDGASDADSTDQDLSLSRALDFSAPGTIAYGSLQPGSESTTSTLVVENTGNDADLDLDISGTAMTCTTGTIAIGRQAYSSSSAANSFSDGVALTGSAVLERFDLAKAQSGSSATTKNLYWWLSVPNTSGLKGTCTGTNTIAGSAS